MVKFFGQLRVSRHFLAVIDAPFAANAKLKKAIARVSSYGRGVPIIERLDGARSVREGLACGESSLDEYLRQRASRHQRDGIATTHVLVEKVGESYLLGYDSLAPIAARRAAGGGSAATAALSGARYMCGAACCGNRRAGQGARRFFACSRSCEVPRFA